MELLICCLQVAESTTPIERTNVVMGIYPRACLKQFYDFDHTARIKNSNRLYEKMMRSCEDNIDDVV